MLCDILFCVVTVETLDIWLVKKKKKSLLKYDSCCNHRRKKNKAIASSETEDKIVISVVSSVFLINATGSYLKICNSPNIQEKKM